MSSMPGPREVVINTGPLPALAAAGHLEALRTVFGRVIVPVEVCREIVAGGRTQFARAEFAAAAWHEQRAAPTALTPYLRAALDPGEAAVIALALSEKVPVVGIDEAMGRRCARLNGLAVTGSLGVLIQAKRQGVPVSVRASIARMRQHGIWLSRTVEAESLRLAGE